MRLYSLQEAGNLPLSSVGRKAVNLSRLYTMGYRICRGVVLGAEALPRYCEANGFSLETAEPQRILAGKFPEDIALLLSEAYHRLRGEKRELIVRSSAGEEDGRERSFAGVFESCLHIQSFFQLEEAVKRVWASFIAPDAAAYRSGRPNGGMAVIFQQMLSCEISGVLFTRDPVNAQDRILVEYTAGHNAGITGGGEKVSRCRVDGKTGAVTEGGNGLPAAIIRRLLRAARHLEAAFGYPCDVEWGARGGRLWLFQVRPMAIRFDPQLYCTVIGDDLDGILLDRYARPASVCYLSLLESWQSRVYLSLFDNRPGREFSERPLQFAYNRVYWNVRYQKAYFEEKPDSRRKRRRLRRWIGCGYRSWYRRLPRYEKTLKRLEAAERVEDTGDLMKILDRCIYNFCVFLGRDHFRFLGIAQLLYGRIREVCGGDEEAIKAAEKLIGRYSMRNMTVEANRSLQRMAAFIRSREEMRCVFIRMDAKEILRKVEKEETFSELRERLREFLTEHGHRGMACDDLYYPHWLEDPVKVATLLQQLVRTDPALLSREAEQEGETKSETALSARLAGGHPHPRRYRRYLTHYWRLCGEYMRLRENQRYYFDKSWVLLRRILLKIGRRFTQEGRLEGMEDVFHLSIEEIRLMSRYSGIPADRRAIAARREAFEREGRNTPPYMIRDSRQIAVQKGSGHTSYKGLGISAGRAEGVVRYIRGAEDFGGLLPGCIGVVDTFHPSWTPILKSVSGLIMCYGNMLSHGAVVAREYGLPVVVFNGNAFSVFQETDRVEIHGDSGRIRIVTRAGEGGEKKCGSSKRP